MKFGIFDKDGSGNISSQEFFDLLDEVIPDIKHAQKREFVNFIMHGNKASDKNKDGLISLNEFNQIFIDFGNYTLEELMPNENPRSEIFSIIEKSYDCDIDFEDSLCKLDRYEDGGIEVHDFKNF